MSREKDPECRAILLDETANAIHVCHTNRPVHGKGWWIPRSQIGYMRKERAELHLANGSTIDLTHVVFTCPEWLIEKKQCWELVP